MRYMHKPLLMVCLLGILSACAMTPSNKKVAPPANSESVNAGFVYGYVEIDNEVVERIDFTEYGKVYVPPFTNPPRVLIYENGVFMAENIKPGKYILSGIHTDRNNYNLARNNRLSYQKIFHIKPGEMEYLGSYNLRVIEKGKLEYGELKVRELQRPGERDVLKHLFEKTEDTLWQDKVARRLKQLWQ